METIIDGISGIRSQKRTEYEIVIVITDALKSRIKKNTIKLTQYND